MQGKATADVLTAAAIPANTTILDAVLGMGNNVNRLFIVSPNFPSDAPSRDEFCVDIIKQRNGGRTLVVAWEYDATHVYARQIYDNNWFSNWRGATLGNIS